MGTVRVVKGDEETTVLVEGILSHADVNCHRCGDPDARIAANQIEVIQGFAVGVHRVALATLVRAEHVDVGIYSQQDDSIASRTRSSSKT